MAKKASKKKSAGKPPPDSPPAEGGEPAEELDEYDRRLLELQKELEDEEKAARMSEMEADLQEDDEASDDEDDPGAPPRKKKRPARKKKRKKKAAAEDEEAEEAGEDEEDPGFVARKKSAMAEAAGDALTELAAETLTSKKHVGEVAVEVVQKHLPALPSRARARNALIGVAGVGVVTMLAWPLIGTVLAWVWFGVKMAALGGVGYGAYWVYNRLPDDPGEGEEGEDEGEEGESEDAEDEAGEK